MWNMKSKPNAPKKKKLVINLQSWYSRKTRFELKYTENGDMTCFVERADARQFSFHFEKKKKKKKKSKEEEEEEEKEKVFALTSNAHPAVIKNDMVR